MSDLFSLMAQHKPGERIPPQDVLECVKKHRLFPQAEASIRLRIPNIQQNFNLGTEVCTHAHIKVDKNNLERKRDLQCGHDIVSDLRVLTRMRPWLSF